LKSLAGKDSARVLQSLTLQERLKERSSEFPEETSLRKRQAQGGKGGPNVQINWGKEKEKSSLASIQDWGLNYKLKGVRGTMSEFEKPDWGKTNCNPGGNWRSTKGECDPVTAK